MATLIYSWVKKIGDGGFGEVWTCVSSEDAKTYAAKELKTTANADAQKRFAREVRILQKLDHPNVVKVLAVRLTTAPFFYVMPLYKCSLRAELSKIVANQARIESVFGAILDGIEYAHGQGVIHRDLKPENVLMNSDADVVISDFGLGRIIDAESARVTFSGAQMGTPLYMAPEQLTNAKLADARSDVFSLGRMLYELYTGPLTTTFDLSQLTPGVAIVAERCTQHDPAKRFQSVADLKAAWQLVTSAGNQEKEEKELSLLRAKFASHGTIDANEINRFMGFLTKPSVDADVLHETLMKLDRSVVPQLCAASPTTMRKLVRTFAEFTSATGWPFSYTDSIGDFCVNLFNNVGDHQVRFDMARCAFLVGSNHNRFYVMEQFGKMLEDIKGAEVLPMMEWLKGVPEHLRKQVAPYVDLKKIHKDVSAFFKFGPKAEPDTE